MDEIEKLQKRANIVQKVLHREFSNGGVDIPVKPIICNKGHFLLIEEKFFNPSSLKSFNFISTLGSLGFKKGVSGSWWKAIKSQQDLIDEELDIAKECGFTEEG